MTSAQNPSTGTATLQDDRIVASGDWTLADAGALSERVSTLKRQVPDGASIDARSLGRVDTAGAGLLLDLAGSRPIDGLDDNRRALFDAVAKAQAQPASNVKPDRGVVALLARTGAAVEKAAGDAYQLLGFIGLLLATLARCVRITRFAVRARFCASEA
jgi:phospholipid/cholesterol/gamma-HCH transport system permease protein